MSTYRTRVLVTGLVWSFMLACSSSEQAGSSDGSADASSPPQRAQAAGDISLDGPIDQALADEGAATFVRRACNSCHTIGSGRLVGPDLAGVTERREPGWIISMITNPDSMIRGDATARQLFAEHMTPMANQNVSVEEARALLEYLRRSDEQN